MTRSAVRRILPAVLLGIGFGGFVDGIVMHQLLQWHHMISSEGCCPTGTVRGLEHNTVADGVFHAVCWVISLLGTFLALREWRADPPSSRAFLGALLIGWGIFNVLDSVNHALGLHHIRDDLGGPVGWDIGFFMLALVLIAAGWGVMRSSDDLKAPDRAGMPP